MTEPASDELIAEFEAGLEGVTPGPWIKSGVIVNVTQEKCQQVGPDGFMIAFLPTGKNDKEYVGALRDAYHIARCSPDNIAALIARIRQQDAEVMTEIPEDVMNAADLLHDKLDNMVWSEYGSVAGLDNDAVALIVSAIMDARDKALEDAAVVADEWAHDAETADASDEWYVGCATACRSFASKTRAMKSTGREESGRMERVLTDGEGEL